MVFSAMLYFQFHEYLKWAVYTVTTLTLIVIFSCQGLQAQPQLPFIRDDIRDKMDQFNIRPYMVDGNVDGIGGYDSADIEAMNEIMGIHYNTLDFATTIAKCPTAADTDLDGIIDATDIARMTNYLALPNFTPPHPGALHSLNLSIHVFSIVI